MTREEFTKSLQLSDPPSGLNPRLAALWWDAKEDWARAHAEVDEDESVDGMRVHAYLHRKQGDSGNAGYWYRRVGLSFSDLSLDAERDALLAKLLS